VCTYYYCNECGCEIWNSMDIGIVGAELQSSSVFPGCTEREYYTKTVMICKSCVQDADNMMEEVANAPESEIDAAFERFCREFDHDTYSGEVLGQWQI